jgi:hypothetical protein
MCDRRYLERTKFQPVRSVDSVLRFVYLVRRFRKERSCEQGVRGSAIVVMAEAVCHELALCYDPAVTIPMQSANGGIDHSLSLAQNVPCEIGNITLYMQIHIICNPAYDILLGRPFDILTESVI